MTVRKRKFPCGHRGAGRYCHRCAQAEALEARAAAYKSSKDKDAKELYRTLTEEAKRLRTEGKGRIVSSYDEPEKTVTA